MWGSPGTILAGRELGLDVTASVDWLQAQRDADGLWTQELYGQRGRGLGPAHGFAGCVLALGNAADRARAFAMHALRQVERNRSYDGRGRYTLWTGDLGTAMYLADCVEGRAALPLP